MPGSNPFLSTLKDDARDANHSKPPPTPLSSAMASFFSKAKSLGKRVVGQSEDEAPAITLNEWVRSLDIKPKRDVRPFSLLECCLFSYSKQIVRYAESLFPIFGWISRYSRFSLLAALRPPADRPSRHGLAIR